MYAASNEVNWFAAVLVLCYRTVKIKHCVKLRFRNLPSTSRTVTFISTERRRNLGFLEEEEEAEEQ